MLEKIEYQGYTYYEFHSICPTYYNKGINTNQLQWLHEGCGKPLYIGDNAKLYCPNCDVAMPIDSYCGLSDDGQIDNLDTLQQAKLKYLDLTIEQKHKNFADWCFIISINGELCNQAGVNWLHNFLSQSDCISNSTIIKDKPLESNIKKLEKDGQIYYEFYAAYITDYEKNIIYQSSYWKHRGCGGRVYIGDNAKVHCPKCDKTTHILNCGIDLNDDLEEGYLLEFPAPRNNILAGYEWVSIIASSGELIQAFGLNNLQKFLYSLAEEKSTTLSKWEKDGFTYYELYISCPVCYSNGKKLPQSYWQHKDCGGQLYMGDNANLYCIKCQTEKNIAYWENGCTHTNDASLDGIVTLLDKPVLPLGNAISMSGQLTAAAGISWLQRFLENLGKDAND